MIVRTEAIVLRAMSYGETSQIVSLFTRERGRISVLARGARLTKSRFGSALQPGSYVQVVYYHKGTRSLQSLSEASHVHAYHETVRDLERITISLRVVELVNALMEEEQFNASVFNLVVQVLDCVNTAEERVHNLLPYFQLRFASILGFAPHLDREEIRDLPEEGGLLLLGTGSVVPNAGYTGAWRRASRAALRAFAILARADLDFVMRMNLNPDVRTEVDHLVEDYLRHHVEDAYPSRGARVIRQITAAE